MSCRSSSSTVVVSTISDGTNARTGALAGWLADRAGHGWYVEESGSPRGGRSETCPGDGRRSSSHRGRKAGITQGRNDDAEVVAPGGDLRRGLHAARRRDDRERGIAGHGPAAAHDVQRPAVGHRPVRAGARRAGADRGRVADRLGRRRVYLVGLVLFAAAPARLRPRPERGLLHRRPRRPGRGRGRDVRDDDGADQQHLHRPRARLAFGIWGAVNGAASAIGPIIGGLLTANFGWRWIFLVNLPVSVVAVALTLRVVTESRDPDPRRVDLPGMVSFTVAAAALTYALIRGAWALGRDDRPDRGHGRRRPRRSSWPSAAAPPRCSTWPAAQPGLHRDAAGRARCCRRPPGRP